MQTVKSIWDFFQTELLGMSCPNNGRCCACVIKHRETDSLPYCLFLDNDGDKSVKNYYQKLKMRFENESETAEH